MSCHVANEESSHERVCFVLPDSKNVQSNPVLKLVVARNTSHGRIKRTFGFLQNVKMTRSMMNGSRCLGVLVWFNETIPFCVSFDGSELNPIITSSVSVIPRCSLVHVDTRHF